MPQLGETVTEGTVTRWTKAVGDSVAEDEVLFEVSTDKVDSEVRSPATGYLTEILVAEGETVDVGVKLAVIGTDPPGSTAGANGTGAGSATDTTTAPAATPTPAPAATTAATPAPAPTTAPAQTTGATPAAPTTARAQPMPADRDPGDQLATDPWGYEGTHDAQSASTDGSGSGAGRVLSPVVRRLLSEHGLDPGQVPATGAGGRITRADVLAAVDARRAATTAATPVPTPPAREAPRYSAPSAPLVRTSPAAAPLVTAGARDEVVPFSNIRRRTAEHMVRSQATSAHTLVAMEVDFEAVEAARRAHKARFLAEEGIKLTYLPFIARALADAVSTFSHLNASVGDDCLIVHRDLHLGIAVDLGDEGLIVPVIHEAGDKRLRAIAREAAELASRARARMLTADDISGGTFTITNPGPFGTFITVPIINQPQVAILSTDGVRRRPVVVTMPDGSEGIAIRSTGVLALSFDHRAIDGAYASRFLDMMRQVLQGRDWSLEI
jgi:pyruvate dehydrogenase E2 component (dihydrolipoamide acetyltransferase)